MAHKPTRKTPTTRTPAKRTPDVGVAERPKLASGPRQVEAQGATLKDDDRLIIAVRVRDHEDKPVTGLTKSNFKIWQLGHFFSDVSGFFVVELGVSPGWKASTTWCERTGRWFLTAPFRSTCASPRAASVPAGR